jgi:hypothetical protein
MAIKRLFVDLFLEAQERAPNETILDLDATDDPVHGEQEGRFFHGYYDGYCYLPLSCLVCFPPTVKAYREVVWQMNARDRPGVEMSGVEQGKEGSF